MPERGRSINVAGRFKIDLDAPQKRETAQLIIEVYGLIENVFFREEEEKEKDDISCVRSAKKRRIKEIERKFEAKRFDEISKIFEKASLKKAGSITVLRFSFPNEIRALYDFKSVYHVKLVEYEPNKFYSKEIAPRLSKKQCKLIRRGLSDREKCEVATLFKKLKKNCQLLHIKSISITKWKDSFGVGINLNGGGRIKIQGCPSWKETKVWIEKNIMS